MKIIIILLWLSLLVGCSTTRDTKTKDLNTVSSCAAPRYSRVAPDQLELRFAEFVRGERQYMTRDCTRYATLTQKFFANRGRGVAKGNVTSNTFGAVVGAPFVLIGDLFFFGDKKTRTHCRGWVLQETKAFEEVSGIPAAFTGKIILIPVTKPEESQEREVRKRSEPILFIIDPDEDEYLLHINGKYRTKNESCSVDQQIILAPEEASSEEEPGS